MLSVQVLSLSHCLTPGPHYVLAPDVALVPMPDGSARILDLNGDFLAVNSEAARLLQVVLEQGPAAARRLVNEQYGPDAVRVHADLDEFLRGLCRRGLLCRSDRRGGSGLRGAILALLLAPLLGVLHRILRPLPARVWALLVIARICFRLFGCARTLRAWQRCHRKAASPSRPEEWERTVREIDEAVRGTAPEHLLHMECKERALCAWTLLRAAHLPASLVIGVRPFPLAGHCWCESGPHTVADQLDHCAAYTPVFRYD